MTEQSPFSHPETGELLDSREDLLAAMKELDDRMSPLYALKYALRAAYLEMSKPAEQPAPRYRTQVQEKVARCPRCGNQLKEENPQ